MLHYQISFTNKVCDTHDPDEIHDVADHGEIAHVVVAGGEVPNGDDDAEAVAAAAVVVAAHNEHDGDVVHMVVVSMHQSATLKLSNTITQNQ